jgi:hypothetical protein
LQFDTAELDLFFQYPLDSGGDALCGLLFDHLVEFGEAVCLCCHDPQYTNDIRIQHIPQQRQTHVGQTVVDWLISPNGAESRTLGIQDTRHHGTEQLGLVGETDINGALGCPDTRCNLLDGGRLETLTQEEVLRRIENLISELSTQRTWRTPGASRG